MSNEISTSHEDSPNEKARLERLKLKAEIDKLQNDNRFVNRHVGAFVSAAAVFVSTMTFLNTCSNQREQAARTEIQQAETNQRQQRETRQQASEHSNRCVELGLRIAEYARQQLSTLGAGATQSQLINMINTIVRVFPPAEAVGILRAIEPALFALTLEPQFASAQQSFSDLLDVLRASGQEAGCHRSEHVLFALQPPRATQAVPPPSTPVAAAPVAAAPAAATSCPSVDERPPGMERLLVFSQIVRGGDRDAARRILDRAKTLDPSFTRAPIEDVAARNPAAQRANVRYYFVDQRAEAEALVALVKRAACLEGVESVASTLQATYIGDRFQNLPRGRIELWFPQLTATP